MKSRKSLQLLSVILCACILSSNGWARLPVPYKHQGVIASVDSEACVLVLAAPPKPKFRLGGIVKPTKFVWTSDTQFIQDHKPGDARALATGAVVRLYYRYSTSKKPPYLVKVLWPDKNMSAR